MDLDEINRLIELMNKNDLLEVELVEDAKKIRLKKKYDGGMRVVPAMAPLAAAPTAQQPAAAPAQAAQPAGTIAIKSPMVGTFYRAANPEAPPYVQEGDNVNKDSTVCMIEAMKVFNEIKAEMEGTIAAILVENGQSVEYGQPLFLVKPS
ncbi:MAG: Biotin carboxyl carrier protein of acetyl-CoA carboxylase [Planctomycetes bacterium]|nr:Biotin carboxyl carrier protein of acetyl-CoA carboxylase [Planctomycetota bacterium]